MELLDVGVGCCRDWMDVGVGGGEEEDVGLKGNDDVQMEVVWLNTGVQRPGGGVGYPV